MQLLFLWLVLLSAHLLHADTLLCGPELTLLVEVLERGTVSAPHFDPAGEWLKAIVQQRGGSSPDLDESAKSTLAALEADIVKMIENTPPEFRLAAIMETAKKLGVAPSDVRTAIDYFAVQKWRDFSLAGSSAATLARLRELGRRVRRTDGIHFDSLEEPLVYPKEVTLPGYGKVKEQGKLVLTTAKKFIEDFPFEDLRDLAIVLGVPEPALRAFIRDNQILHVRSDAGGHSNHQSKAIAERYKQYREKLANQFSGEGGGFDYFIAPGAPGKSIGTKESRFGEQAREWARDLASGLPEEERLAIEASATQLPRQLGMLSRSGARKIPARGQLFSFLSEIINAHNFSVEKNKTTPNYYPDHTTIPADWFKSKDGVRLALEELRRDAAREEQWEAFNDPSGGMQYFLNGNERGLGRTSNKWASKLVENLPLADHIPINLPGDIKKGSWAEKSRAMLLDFMSQLVAAHNQAVEKNRTEPNYYPGRELIPIDWYRTEAGVANALAQVRFEKPVEQTPDAAEQRKQSLQMLSKEFSAEGGGFDYFVARGAPGNSIGSSEAKFGERGKEWALELTGGLPETERSVIEATAKELPQHLGALSRRGDRKEKVRGQVFSFLSDLVEAHNSAVEKNNVDSGYYPGHNPIPTEWFKSEEGVRLALEELRRDSVVQEKWETFNSPNGGVRLFLDLNSKPREKRPGAPFGSDTLKWATDLVSHLPETERNSVEILLAPIRVTLGRSIQSGNRIEKSRIILLNFLTGVVAAHNQAVEKAKTEPNYYPNRSNIAPDWYKTEEGVATVLKQIGMAP